MLIKLPRLAFDRVAPLPLLNPFKIQAPSTAQNRDSPSATVASASAIRFISKHSRRSKRKNSPRRCKYIYKRPAAEIRTNALR